MEQGFVEDRVGFCLDRHICSLEMQGRNQVWGNQRCVHSERPYLPVHATDLQLLQETSGQKEKTIK